MFKDKREDLLSSKDQKAILKPISKDDPAGPSLRYEAIYDDIQKARKAEEDLPQGVWEHSLKESQWDVVMDLALSGLQERSKDLQLALWLTEAWFHNYQAQGLATGLSLCHNLLKTFWDSFHPYSKDDPEYRVAPLLWFDREMSKSMTQLVIAPPTDEQEGVLTYWDYQSRVLLPAERTDQSDKAEKEKSERVKTFYKRVDATSTEFYVKLQGDLKEARQSLGQIEAMVESAYPDFPGCLMHTRGKLDQIVHFIEQITSKRIPENNNHVETSSPKPPATDDKKAASAHKSKTSKDAPSKEAQSSGKTSKQTHTSSKQEQRSMANLNIRDYVDDRQKAYALLSDIADYLTEIEPHSPTPYLIRRAVSWGEMSLGEVLNDLAQQGGNMESAMRFLGMTDSKTGS